MKWQMPIGVDNFFDIRSKHYYFVDKTDFIRQLIDGQCSDADYAAAAVRQDVDPEYAGVFLFY